MGIFDKLRLLAGAYVISNILLESIAFSWDDWLIGNEIIIITVNLLRMVPAWECQFGLIVIY